MDVSEILTSNASKFASTDVDNDNMEIDTGLLTITDVTPIDKESYNENLEEHLTSLARSATQSLIGSLFSLPSQKSQDGPLAVLPPPVTQLPRTKPLPKPKPPTKWELFAKAKGIQHKTRDRKVWDEEKQDWVNRWGRDAKNKEKEDQWITEVPMNADADYDPRKAARDERKARVAKNERHRLQNLARASSNPRDARKQDIEKTLASSRVSTASMGKYDKKLEGEGKVKGVKRKFAPIEAPVRDERKASLALIQRMESDSKKIRRDPAQAESVVNVRKAVRHASKGQGSVALASKSREKVKSTGKRGKRR